MAFARRYLPLLSSVIATLCVFAGPAAAVVSVPAEVSEQLNQGDSVDVIVEFDATAVERELAPLRAKLPGRIADKNWLRKLQGRYQQLKEVADTAHPIPESEVLEDYSHLPMRALHLRSLAALAALEAHPHVRAVYSNSLMQRVQATAPGLMQIDQPAVAAVGYTGSGTTVAVIDDGIDITNSAFGCTAVATPAGCRVVVNQNFVASPGTEISHGTNVAAIVASVAPSANIAMLNVFTATGASTSSIISAINWAIANRSVYNIAALNMSLGDSGHYTSACTSNSYVTPVANARAAGISVVAAAGNSAYVSNVFTPGLPIPACTPGVISVGAVYNANLGGLLWGTSPYQCTDYTTQLDQVVCFSQSAANLTLLAPGALITAGGITMGGTSQASPHVAGAVAVLRAAFPSESLATSLTRLTSAGAQITDARNGVTTPRLKLDAAAQPANDTFGARQSVSGSTGSTSGVNILALLGTDASVPAAAGTAPVWWTWTAPATGQVTLSTAGSNFPTQLAVFTGTSLSALQQVTSAANVSATDMTSQVLFEAQAGKTYQWAVGSASGATGNISLQWSVNASAVANLSSTISGPQSAVVGALQPYLLSVKNSGPQTATNVSLVVALPTGTLLGSTPAGCTLAASGSTLTCNVAQLASGATAAWTVDLTWTTVGGETLSASVASDVPDSGTSSSGSTLTVQANPGNSNGEVPLPPWALGLLATALLAGARLRPQRLYAIRASDGRLQSALRPRLKKALQHAKDEQQSADHNARPPGAE